MPRNVNVDGVPSEWVLQTAYGEVEIVMLAHKVLLWYLGKKVELTGKEFGMFLTGLVVGAKQTESDTTST